MFVRILVLVAMASCAVVAQRNWTHVPRPADMSEVVGDARMLIEDGGVRVTFAREGPVLSLAQIQRPGDAPILYRDATSEGSGPVGNPLAVVIAKGRYQGVYGMSDFRVNKLFAGPRHVLAYLGHPSLPMRLAMDVSVEGSVIAWQGQVLWNGDEPVEADVYYPLLSRVRFAGPDKDRAIFAQTSGSTRGPLGKVNYRQAYLGKLSSPVFLVEGGGRGIAVVDENTADLAVDPGAAALRRYVVGNSFPFQEGAVQAGGQGPYAGICHTRVFRPASASGGDKVYMAAEAQGPEYFQKLGDAVDLGPVRMFAYQGSWKTGAAWLRTQRRGVPMRESKAPWYRTATFLSEDGLDGLSREGKTYLELPRILERRKKGGADFFHVTGYAEGEMLGILPNWQNRGDYTFAAQGLGGLASMRQGIDAVHRGGGHIIYYVEGMIIWRRSRIGRTLGESFALMNEDGTYTEHYRGFWHACPADRGFQEWFAKTLAQVARETGVDGFFVDSSLATYNHRCFNPAHKHPHPDVWNWGVREMLRQIREELDKVNPEAVVIVEGAGDLGREFADGFLSHTHAWTDETFTVPLARFLHPEMRAFESWGASGTDTPMGLEKLKRLHIWNSVNGLRIYAHAPMFDQMAELSLRTRRYYDAYPEIVDGVMSEREVSCSTCTVQMFEGAGPVVTIGNETGQAVEAEVALSGTGSVLVDRVDNKRVRISAGRAKLQLAPFEFRAFDVRP